MMKMTSSSQARTKLRISTTPEDLMSVAHQLREISNFAGKYETAEVDVVTGGLTITFEYYPVRTHPVVGAISSDDPVKGYSLYQKLPAELSGE